MATAKNSPSHVTVCRKESLYVDKVMCERFPVCFSQLSASGEHLPFENSTQTSNLYQGQDPLEQRMRAPTISHRGFCRLTVDHDQHSDAMICSSQGPVPQQSTVYMLCACRLEGDGCWKENI